MPAPLNKPSFSPSTKIWCKHDKPQLVYKEPFPVWAGSAQAHCPIPKGALLLDLADMYSCGIYAYNVQLPKALQLKRLHVEWPDMGRAFLDKDDWVELVDWFKRDWQQKGIYIACQAGHGRTGTALAIIGKMMGAVPEGVDPIAHVRKAYCQDAVESASQIEYLEQVLDYKTKETGILGSGYSGTTFVSKPCNKSLKGPECEHTCYNTADNHTQHWCKLCKWDWRIVAAPDGLVLIEEPGPEIKSKYETGHKRETKPAPPIITVIGTTPNTGTELKNEPVTKSAEESAQTFLAPTSALGSRSTDGIDRKECNAIAKENCNTMTCYHMCGRWENHAGTHECQFCNSRFGNSTMACSFRWENSQGCTDHVCAEGWGHSGSHTCDGCEEMAPYEWDN